MFNANGGWIEPIPPRIEFLRIKVISSFSFNFETSKRSIRISVQFSRDRTREETRKKKAISAPDWRLALFTSDFSHDEPWTKLERTTLLERFPHLIMGCAWKGCFVSFILIRQCGVVRASHAEYSRRSYEGFDVWEDCHGLRRRGLSNVRENRKSPLKEIKNQRNRSSSMQFPFTKKYSKFFILFTKPCFNPLTIIVIENNAGTTRINSVEVGWDNAFIAATTRLASGNVRLQDKFSRHNVEKNQPRAAGFNISSAKGKALGSATGVYNRRNSEHVNGRPLTEVQKYRNEIGPGKKPRSVFALLSLVNKKLRTFFRRTKPGYLFAISAYTTAIYFIG